MKPFMVNGAFVPSTFDEWFVSKGIFKKFKQEYLVVYSPETPTMLENLYKQIDDFKKWYAKQLPASFGVKPYAEKTETNLVPKAKEIDW